MLSFQTLKRRWETLLRFEAVAMESAALKISMTSSVGRFGSVAEFAVGGYEVRGEDIDNDMNFTL